MYYHITKDGRMKSFDLNDSFGGSIFLCGGHPSLKDQPTEMLEQRGIITMVMNNTATLVKPDLWICADKPECYSKSILLDPSFMKFARLNYVHNKVDGTPWKDFPNTYFFGSDENYKVTNLLEGNSKLVWWKNVFFMAVQLSYRLGFRRIYLCGCGFSIDKDSQYAYDTKLNLKQVNYNQKLYSNAVDALVRLKPHFNDKGLELISCTPESSVNDHFEYMDFEAAVQFELNKIPKHDTKNVKHSSETH